MVVEQPNHHCGDDLVIDVDVFHQFHVVLLAGVILPYSPGVYAAEMCYRCWISINCLLFCFRLYHGHNELVSVEFCLKKRWQPINVAFIAQQIVGHFLGHGEL